MRASDEQSRNALWPMEVTPDGRLVRASEEQPVNASVPMEVTPSMLIDTRAVHPANALLPILVVLAGISTCPFASGVIKQAPYTLWSDKRTSCTVYIGPRISDARWLQVVTGSQRTLLERNMSTG